MTFLEKAPVALTALRDASQRGDGEAMRRAAHMLCGTSGMLGARRLARQCAELEHLGRSGPVPDATSRVTAIEASYRTVATALREGMEIGPR